MRTRLRALQLVLSAGILVWIYSKVPLGSVLDTIRSAEPGWIVLGALLVLCLQVVIAMRWGRLVDEQGWHLPLGTLVSIHLASAFYKLFIPGGMLAAIGVRFYKLQQHGGDRSAVLSSVLVDRLLATVGLALVGLVAWLADTPPAPPVVGWTIAGWFTGVVTVLVVAVNPRTARGMRSLEARGRWRAVTSRLVRLADAFGTYRAMRRAPLAVLGLTTIVPHVIGLFAFWTLGRAVGIHVDLVSWAWLRAAINLITTQPISIAGLGVREVVTIWLLAFFGVAREPALAMASLLLGVTVILPAAMGAVIEARGLVLRPRPSA